MCHDQKSAIVQTFGNMAKVVQYPHYLFVVVPGESTQDDNGNWIASESKTVFHGMCRDETDGRGSEVRTADGVFHHATSLVQCPKGTPIIPFGATCIVANDADGADVRHTGVCLRFDPSQLHCRLWL